MKLEPIAQLRELRTWLETARDRLETLRRKGVLSQDSLGHQPTYHLALNNRDVALIEVLDKMDELAEGRPNPNLAQELKENDG